MSPVDVTPVADGIQWRASTELKGSDHPASGPDRIEIQSITLLATRPCRSRRPAGTHFLGLPRAPSTLSSRSAGGLSNEWPVGSGSQASVGCAPGIRAREICQRPCQASAAEADQLR